ncbi:MAG: hypothetical protein ABIV94_05200 [Acidimicrobiales bacterium]
MGFRRWFLQLLARGEVAALDPAEMVDLETVPLARGPVLVAGLEQEGINVSAIESFNVATTTRSNMRLMVRRDQFADACVILERIR